MVDSYRNSDDYANTHKRWTHLLDYGYIMGTKFSDGEDSAGKLWTRYGYSYNYNCSNAAGNHGSNRKLYS